MIRGRMISMAAALAAIACARIEAPPGGPPDTAPPQLISVEPDSMAVVPGFDGEVEFVFDEVVSEGTSPNVGAGTGDLERLVVLSPSPNVPEVSWRRSRIGVRPREGWQPDRVYRVELLPGVVDLRQNRASGTATVLTFTTGAPAPSTYLTGRVMDWSSGRPAAGALVEALLVRDSLAYRTHADSSGSFRFGPLPSGAYVLYGVLDANRNRQRDPREAFASVELPPDSTAAGTLYTFVHDTTPPRGRTATLLDSVRASVAATQPLLPGQTIAAAQVRVALLPDSTPVAVASAGLRPPADTTVEPGERAPLTSDIIVELAAPFARSARYVIIADSVRNVSGVPGQIVAVLDVPAAPAAPVPSDTLRPPAESGRAPADTVRAPSDTLRATPDQ